MAGNKDRQRRVARDKYERQRALRQARQSRNRKRFLVVVSALAAVGLVIGLTFAFATGGKGTPKAASSHSPSPSATPSASTVAEPAHHCTYTAASPTSKKVTFPPATPDYTGTYTATIKTSVGDIKLNLLNSKATCTVNSFIHLAEQGFYDSTQCHRMLTTGIYVLQCGDAYATASTKLTCSTTSKVGSGFPGYEYASENLTGAKYGPGIVAMANEGSATTNGSQFFFLYKDSTSGLTGNGSAAPAYTPFATVSSGLNIIQNVAKDGFSCQYPSADGGGGVPKKKVIIDSVTIQKT